MRGPGGGIARFNFFDLLIPKAFAVNFVGISNANIYLYLINGKGATVGSNLASGIADAAGFYTIKLPNKDDIQSLKYMILAVEPTSNNSYEAFVHGKNVDVGLDTAVTVLTVRAALASSPTGDINLMNPSSIEVLNTQSDVIIRTNNVSDLSNGYDEVTNNAAFRNQLNSSTKTNVNLTDIETMPKRDYDAVPACDLAQGSGIVNNPHCLEKKPTTCTEKDRKMWIIGGTPKSDKSDAVYSSADGNTWTLVGHLPEGRAGRPIAFDNKLWLIGGEDRTGASRDNVWSSTEGKTWISESTLPVPVNSSAELVVFDKKLWLVGGYRYSINGDPYAGIWSSSDGKKWTQGIFPYHVYADAGSLLVYKGKMWLVGGREYNGTPRGGPSLYSKVWSSADGTNWTQVGTLPVGRWNGSMAVFNDKMFFIAGEDTHLSNVKDEIWSSTDGKTWTLEGNLPEARHYHAAEVFLKQLWIIGGAAGLYRDNVWASSDGKTWNTKANFPIPIGQTDLVVFPCGE